jgi:chaperonin cofactor prefoldin
VSAQFTQLQNEITALQGQVSNLNSVVSTLQTQVFTLQGQMTTANNNIAALQAQLNGVSFGNTIEGVPVGDLSGRFAVTIQSTTMSIGLYAP